MILQIVFLLNNVSRWPIVEIDVQQYCYNIIILFIRFAELFSWFGFRFGARNQMKTRKQSKIRQIHAIHAIQTEAWNQCSI